MPLWRIFSHPDTFTFSQREALAKDVTALYVSMGLPAFYVNVIVSCYAHSAFADCRYLHDGR